VKPSWKLSSLILLVVLVCGLICVVAGCKAKEQAPPTPVVGPPEQVEKPVAEQPEGEPIKVGAIFSVTGPASSLGTPEKQTVEMFAEQINSEGGILGRPLEVMVKDDASENDAAAVAAKDLLSAGVCAIIGPSRTPCTMAIKDAVQEAKCPLVSCAAGTPITEPVEESYWTFRTPQTDRIAVAKIVDYLKKENITKVASIYIANPFGEAGNKQLEEQLPAAGVEIVAKEKFTQDDTDMTPHLTRIKAKNPEAVICWAVQAPPATVAKNIKDLGMTCKVIMSHGVANKKFIELAGPAAEGVMFPAGKLIVRDEIPDTDPQKQLLIKYGEDFQAKYSAEPDTFGGHAYDALLLVRQAIEAAGEPDRAKIRDELEKTSGVVGIGGVFTYSATDHDGLTKDAFVWVQIKDGKWTLAE